MIGAGDVREAVDADEGAVVALWRACGLLVGESDPGADFRFALDGPASTVLVGASPDGAIIGTVMVGHDGHRGWFYYVAAAPTLQRQGIGRAMIEAAERWLAARDVPKAQLMVRHTNAAVTAFYEKLGYETAPRIFLHRWLNKP